MKQYEYRVTAHPAEEFRQVAWFCGQDGACNLEEVPGDQIGKLSEILNGKGREGWELVHMHFGRDGMMAFWKREILMD